MRVTGFGVVVLVALAVCAVVVVAAPGRPRDLAFAVGVLVVAVMAADGLATRGDATDIDRKRQVLRRYARSRRRSG